MTVNKKKRISVVLFLSILISACGGGGSDDTETSPQSAIPTPTTPQPVTAPVVPPPPAPTPAPAEPVQPSPVISQPTPSPGAPPTTPEEPLPPLVQDLIQPILTADLIGNTINLSWSESNASEYRVLYKRNGLSFEEFTTNHQLSLGNLQSGNYTIYVEAYDELGNSLFASPARVTVL